MVKGISWAHRETRCRAERPGVGAADLVSQPQMASENQAEPVAPEPPGALAQQGPQPRRTAAFCQPAPPGSCLACEGFAVCEAEGSGPNPQTWRPGRCWPSRAGTAAPGQRTRPAPGAPNPQISCPKQKTLLFPTFSQKTWAGTPPVRHVLREEGCPAPGPHCLRRAHAPPPQE